ncbi:TPA: Glu/Leu/Phe/Val dehydrogenase [Candidatus Pacearchaeota archaeon]|jgi:leucine dehydrogenase|nr:Glu/Leu/Phe/Val dehydrogenase [Candidatus Pacearchaeota archaeon]
MEIKNLNFPTHEKVMHCKDKSSGLNAVISIHDTNFGKTCLGGCRMYPYSSDNEMIQDALELSRKMTSKNALANLCFGGSKCVIRGDPKKDKTEKLLLSMGKFINSFKGKIYTGQDSGISSEDVNLMAKETEYLVGRSQKSGDPSIPTALGIYFGLKGAVKSKLNQEDFSDLDIIIFGAGSVGTNLVKIMQNESCKIYLTDIEKKNIKRIEKEFPIIPIYETEKIFEIPCNIFSPNVTGSTLKGGALNKKRLISIYNNRKNKNSVIIGGGTNVIFDNFSTNKYAGSLENLTVIPPQIINAGGVISVASEITGETRNQVYEKISKIGNTIEEIIIESEKTSFSLNEISENLAFERIRCKKYV